MTNVSSSPHAAGHWALLAFCVFPLALAHQPVVRLLPGVGAGQVVFWYCLAVLAAAVYVCGGRTSVRLLPWPLIAFSVLMLVSQSTAMYASAAFWGSQWAELLAAYGLFLLEAFVLVICAVCVRLLATLPGGLSGLWAGWLTACGLLLAVCLLQCVHVAVSTWNVPSFLAALRPYTTAVLNFLTSIPVLGMGRGWENGTINGLFASGRELALATSLLVVPPLLGVYREAGSWKRLSLGFLLLCLLPLLLAGTQSVAAFLAAVLLGFWLIVEQLERMKATRTHWLCFGALCLMLCSGFVVLLALDADSRIFAGRVLDGNWNAALRVVLEELWSVFVEQPWHGVGQGWAEAFVLHSDSLLGRLGLDSVRFWLDGAAMPGPSWLVRVLAEFGAVLPLVALAGMIGLHLRLRRLGSEGALPGVRLVRTVFPIWLSSAVLFCLGNMESNPVLFWLPLAACWAAAGLERPRSESKPQEKKPGPPESRSDATARVLRETLISDSSSRPFTTRSRP